MQYKTIATTKPTIEELAAYLDDEMNKLAADGWILDQSIIYTVQNGTFSRKQHAAMVRMKKV